MVPIKRPPQPAGAPSDATGNATPVTPQIMDFSKVTKLGAAPSKPPLAATVDRTLMNKLTDARTAYENDPTNAALLARWQQAQAAALTDYAMKTNLDSRLVDNIQEILQPDTSTEEGKREKAKIDALSTQQIINKNKDILEPEDAKIMGNILFALRGR